MKTYIAANWKMHGDLSLAGTLAQGAVALAASLPASVDVILCPPATLLRDTAGFIAGSRVRLGGQDCHEQPEGAFTGDISAPMLREIGCSHVIVGHSERRSGHKESSLMVRKKAHTAIKTGLVPLICIGETQDEREAGNALSVVEQQLWESVPEELGEAEFLLAYEPVWAIGTGNVASRQEIADMHGYIHKAISKKTGLAEGRVPVLYGGSVKAASAPEILTIEGVSGVLVGGASLKAEEFHKIAASMAA